MSRLLAIDAETGVVHVAAGSPKGGTMRVDRAVSLRLGGTLTPANAAELGRELREALKASGVAPAPVVAVVGRERLIIKDVTLPPDVPSDREPDVVRFQAQKDMTESPDSVVLDYYRLDRDSAAGQSLVVSASVRKDVINAYKTFCQSAGLRLVAVTPRSLGSLAAYDRAVATGAVTAPEERRPSIAIMTRGEKWGELLIARDGQVVFSRVISAAALASETMLLGEMRRNLAVYNGQNAQQPVQGVYVAESTGPGSWSGRLRAALNVPVQSFDPLDGVEHDVAVDAIGHFAPLVGLLSLKSQGRTPIDFISPRQPIIRVSKARQWTTGLVGLFSVLVIAGLGLGYMKLRAKDSELRRAMQLRTELETEVSNLEKDRKRIAAFNEWNDQRINWLDELYDFTYEFPDIKASATRLEQFRGEPRQPEKNSKIKLVGRVIVKVSTDSAPAFAGLQANLRGDKHYHGIVPTNKGAGGIGTRLQAYELRAEIERRPPNEFIRVLEAKVPSKPRRGKEDSEGGGGNFGGGFGQFGGGFGGGQ